MQTVFEEVVCFLNISVFLVSSVVICFFSYEVPVQWVEVPVMELDKTEWHEIEKFPGCTPH